MVWKMIAGYILRCPDCAVSFCHFLLIVITELVSETKSRNPNKGLLCRVESIKIKVVAMIRSNTSCLGHDSCRTNHIKEGAASHELPFPGSSWMSAMIISSESSIRDPQKCLWQGEEYTHSMQCARIQAWEQPRSFVVSEKE